MNRSKYISVVSAILFVLFFGLSCTENPTAHVDSVPSISVTSSSDGDTVGLYNSHLPLEPVKISTSVSESQNITKVEFYVDGDVIGEDDSWPFEIDWHAHFWADYYGADVITHSIEVLAIDSYGRTARSETQSVFVLKMDSISPIVLNPSTDYFVTESDTVHFLCSPIPGAKGYSFLFLCEGIPNGVGIHKTSNPAISIYIFAEMPEMYWSVRAWWDEDHTTEWSSVRTIH